MLFCVFFRFTEANTVSNGPWEVRHVLATASVRGGGGGRERERRRYRHKDVKSHPAVGRVRRHKKKENSENSKKGSPAFKG